MNPNFVYVLKYQYVMDQNIHNSTARVSQHNINEW